MDLRRIIVPLAACSAACGSVSTSTPDAAMTVDAAMVDGAVGGARCDPQKAFAAPTLVPSVNTSNDESNFTLTRDELTAFVGAVVQPPALSGRILVTQRSSTSAAFATPSATLTAAINNVSGEEYSPSSVSDGLSLYFHRQNAAGIGIVVATRIDGQSAFAAETAVTVDGSGLSPALGPRISNDGQTLYWDDYNDFKLRTAARASTQSNFTGNKVASTMAVGSVVLSADELTLYYGNGNGDDILVSSRASKATTFGPGTVVPNINSAQQDYPLHLSADGCVLYLASTRPGGLGGYDIWEAHRPM